MKKMQLLGAALGAVVLGLTGCATGSSASGAGGSNSSGSKTAAMALPGKEGCFWLLNVENWEVLDQSTLIVYAPLPKDAFLVKLFEPVPDLSFHQRIAFDDGNHDGQICSLGDNILLHDMGERRIPISAVRELSGSEVKSLKAAAKLNSAAPPKPPTTGASAASP